MKQMKPKKIKLSELMEIEKKLLYIEAEHIFELDFQEALTLTNYLSRIGKITALAFELQHMYAKQGANISQLNEYHMKISNSMIRYNNKSVLKFIDTLNNKYKWKENSKQV